MRFQHLKLKKGRSTRAERVFAEMLKRNHIPFRTKVKIADREVDFLIGNIAIEIDGHEQNGTKNEELAKAGYVPLHFNNKEIYSLPPNYYLTYLK